VGVGEAADHLPALLLDRLGKRADAQAAGGVGAPVLVDDDDRETELHVGSLRDRVPAERADVARGQDDKTADTRGATNAGRAVREAQRRAVSYHSKQPVIEARAHWNHRT